MLQRRPVSIRCRSRSLEHFPFLRSEPQASACATVRRMMHHRGRMTRHASTGIALATCLLIVSHAERTAKRHPLPQARGRCLICRGSLGTAPGPREQKRLSGPAPYDGAYSIIARRRSPRPWRLYFSVLLIAYHYLGKSTGKNGRWNATAKRACSNSPRVTARRRSR